MEDFVSANIGNELSEAGREFFRRGWVMGTSGNFSSLLSVDPPRVFITASGLEKGRLSITDFLVLDGNGKALRGDGKPSAESMIHLAIYQVIPTARSILHTHSVWGTILSDVFFENGAIRIEGYEMLKGLSGVQTHEHKEIVPIVENSQDYGELSNVIQNSISVNRGIHGIYLRRHGLYTWGDSIAEARRHIEIFEFLFEVLGRRSS
ncbi:MAG: methylthioribulose 1-phosphate dehydratase [Pyrinomonadaceae bacterium]